MKVGVNMRSCRVALMLALTDLAVSGGVCNMVRLISYLIVFFSLVIFSVWLSYDGSSVLDDISS